MACQTQNVPFAKFHMRIVKTAPCGKKTCFLKDLLYKGHVAQHVLMSSRLNSSLIHSCFVRNQIHLFKKEAVGGVRRNEGPYMNDKTT